MTQDNLSLEKSSIIELEKQIKDLNIAENEKLLTLQTETNIEINKSKEKIDTLEITVENLEGEINRMKRCQESYSRDLKRAIRDKETIEKSYTTLQKSYYDREKEYEKEKQNQNQNQKDNNESDADPGPTGRRNSDAMSSQIKNGKESRRSSLESLLHVPSFMSSIASCCSSSSSSTPFHSSTPALQLNDQNGINQNNNSNSNNSNSNISSNNSNNNNLPPAPGPLPQGSSPRQTRLPNLSAYLKGSKSKSTTATAAATPNSKINGKDSF